MLGLVLAYAFSLDLKMFGVCKEISQLVKQAGRHGMALRGCKEYHGASHVVWVEKRQRMCVIYVYPPGLYFLCHTLLSFSFFLNELAFQSPMYCRFASSKIRLLQFGILTIGFRQLAPPPVGRMERRRQAAARPQPGRRGLADPQPARRSSTGHRARTTLGE